MSLDKQIALLALKSLDEALQHHGWGSMTLIVGGGGAMILAHNFAGKTKDIDAVPKGRLGFDELDKVIKSIAQTLGLESDWLNPYFSSYIYYLPQDYGHRLINIFEGHQLKVVGLGVEDLLIMKLMAGRDKDLKHIKFLMKKNPNLEIVEERLIALEDSGKKEAQLALELFHHICEEMGL